MDNIVNPQLKIESNFDLTAYNFLKLQSSAEFFCQLETLNQIEALIEFIQSNNIKKIFILGEGSNVILANDNIKGLVIQNSLLKKEDFNQLIIKENEDEVFLTIPSGMNWNDFVLYSCKQGWYGVENLVGIPGNIGAAVIQNIGAYGMEISEVIESVTAIDLLNETKLKLTQKELDFNYRNSIFKKQLTDHYLIIQIEINLKKTGKFNLSYKDLLYLKNKTVTHTQLAKIITDIRNSKLLNPKELPNVGSFFINPIIDQTQLNQLKKHPLLKDCDLFYQKIATHIYKISAAQLIDKLDWKGYYDEKTAVGISKNHTLNLYQNNKCNTGKNILKLANAIQRSVKDNFDIPIQIEPIKVN